VVIVVGLWGKFAMTSFGLGCSLAVTSTKLLSVRAFREFHRDDVRPREYRA